MFFTIVSESIQLKPIYTTAVEKPKTAILWVSRHEPLPAQIRFLEQKFGAISILQLSGTVTSAEYIIEWCKKLGVKIIVPVLPLSMIAKLVEIAPKEGIIVLWAEMKQIGVFESKEEAERVKSEAPEKRTIVEYSGGKFRVFEFVKFHRIKAVKLELEEF